LAGKEDEEVARLGKCKNEGVISREKYQRWFISDVLKAFEQLDTKV
jgi:hypothetical protein